MTVDASTAGELVVLSLGNFGATMHFADALKVSALLLEKGREARRIAIGPRSAFMPALRAMGEMTDAAADAVKPSRWHRELPDRYEAKDIFVRTSGKLVELAFRTTVAGLPWEGALHIAQVLRIRGRQARNNANEKASWDAIVKH